MTKTLSTNGVVSNDVHGNGMVFKTAEVSTDEGEAPDATNTEGKTATAKTGATNQTDDATSEDKLPKRLRGKSEQERIDVYRNLESELGRKNNEVGQLRYTIDEMLRMRRQEDLTAAQAKATKTEPVTGEKLLTDPEKTIESVAERVVGKKADAVEERLARMEFDAQRGKFETRFPKYETTMADETFVEWVKQSPYRQRLAQSAAAQGSFEAATELFGLYEEVENVREARVTGNDPKQAKEGSLVRPGNGNTTGGAAKKTAGQGQGNKKIFSRTELGLLYARDRDAYNAMGDEIRLAYREGRVK